MDILGILKAFIGAMTGAFLAMTGTGTTPTAIQVQGVASTTQEVVQATDAIVEETVATTPSPTSEDVRQAYELGKTVGNLEAQAQKITSQPTTTMTQEESSAPVGEPTPQIEPQPAPVEEVAGVGASEPLPPTVVSIDIRPITLARPLDQTFKQGDSAYVTAVVHMSDGAASRTETVEVTATDPAQNKTLVGTGNIRDGEYYYPFEYLFKTTGTHTVTFSAGGVSASVTMTAE